MADGGELFSLRLGTDTDYLSVCAQSDSTFVVTVSTLVSISTLVLAQDDVHRLRNWLTGTNNLMGFMAHAGPTDGFFFVSDEPGDPEKWTIIKLPAPQSWLIWRTGSQRRTKPSGVLGQKIIAAVERYLALETRNLD